MIQGLERCIMQVSWNSGVAFQCESWMNNMETLVAQLPKTSIQLMHSQSDNNESSEVPDRTLLHLQVVWRREN